MNYEKESTSGNKIDLTIKYVAGNYTDDFNVHQTIGHVLDKSVNHFKIDETAKHNLGLFNNGNQLNNETTIEQIGLNDGQVLILSSIKSTDVEG